MIFFPHAQARRGASMALALFLANRAVYPIDYETFRILKIAAAGGMIFAASFLVTSSRLGVEFLLKSFLLAGFFGVLFGLRFFQPGEFRAFAQALRKT